MKKEAQKLRELLKHLYQKKFNTTTMAKKKKEDASVEEVKVAEKQPLLDANGNPVMTAEEAAKARRGFKS